MVTFYETLFPQPFATPTFVFCPVQRGELYFGAYKSNRVEDNIRQIDDFVNRNVILDSDSITAKYYGQIKNKLKIEGKPIPENDIPIAAIAMQFNLTLVSRDKHLQEIENLPFQQW